MCGAIPHLHNTPQLRKAWGQLNFTLLYFTLLYVTLLYVTSLQLLAGTDKPAGSLSSSVFPQTFCVIVETGLSF